MKLRPAVPKNLTFDGVQYQVVKPDIGSGAQGSVHLIERKDNPSQKAIAKSLPNNPVVIERTEFMIDSGLGHELPFLSAPLAMTKVKSGKKQSIFYLSTYVDGVSLEKDVARPLTDLLMMAYQSVCLWVLLERLNIAHGDISFTNLMVSRNRSMHMIDADNYMALGTSIPGPTMYGQHPVMAPELRQAERDKRPPVIDLTTDRFAWATVLSYQILQRHPASWVYEGPKAFDAAMSWGRWPEHKRKNDLAIKALGPKLPELFNKGFSLSALQRPDAATWKEALREAIGSLHIHSCGTAFVHDETRRQCPKCRKQIPPPMVSTAAVSGVKTLIFEHIESGEKANFQLHEGQFIYVGRDNLPNASGYVSNQHLQFYRNGQTLYITHIGRNPSAIQFQQTGEACHLNDLQEPVGSGRLDNAAVTLGDTKYRISIG